MQLAQSARPSAGRHRLRPSKGGLPRSGFRPDIQGLRALAVVLVVIYHLYPDVLSGGYVGVDVFFVISGFLITGHLTQKFLDTGKVRLLEFYGRRARRLLPAAVLVLMVTWLLSRLLLPITQQPAAANQIRASALYIQNWVLAHNSVDYLAANRAPSPVTHYWSLSVEEQFYLIWPLLFVAAVVTALVARKRWGASERGARRAGAVAATLLALAIVGASLGYSVHETATNAAAAYFITPTRLWELGVGGVLALLYPVVTRWIGRWGWVAWVGLVMVLWSAIRLSGSTAFPGWIAVVPILGTALLIASGSGESRFGPAVLFARRPLVFVGDISYSLYLWHWPMIVLWLAFSGGTIGVLDGPMLIAASGLLAWLTKVLVEDKVRTARWVTAYPGRSLATAVTAVVPVALTTVFLVQQQPTQVVAQPDAQHAGAAALAAPADATSPSSSESPASSRPGSSPASSRPGSSPVSESTGLPGVPPAPGAPEPASSASSPADPSSVPTPAGASSAPTSPGPSSILPPVAQAPHDKAFGNRDRCRANTTSTRLFTCTTGDTSNPRLTVALVGDSYAGEWSDALSEVAKKQHWKLVTVIHGGCPWTAVEVLRHGDTKPFEQCYEWGRKALDLLLHEVKPDVAIISARPKPTVPEHPTFDATSQRAIADGMVQYWRQLADAGTYVVGIHPTPEPAVNVPDCIASRTGTVEGCTVPRDKAVRTVDGKTPIGMAVDSLGSRHATEINLNDRICETDECPPVVGNVMVYRDSMHLTRTYTLTLVPYLQRDLLSIPALRSG